MEHRTQVLSNSVVLAVLAALCLCAPRATGDEDPGKMRDVVVRVVNDGATGDRWLLLRDAAHPGGPGRMVRVGRERAASDSPPSPLRPVVRAGDAIVVEEHTDVVDARLEATALTSAPVGWEFKARLKIGGKVVKAIALAPGKAALEPDERVQP